MDYARTSPGNGNDGSGIPDDLRCKRSNGKQWRCTALSMPDKTVCEKHYIQAKKRAANSAMRAGMKKAKRNSLGESDIYLESKSDDMDSPIVSSNHEDYSGAISGRKYSDKPEKTRALVKKKGDSNNSSSITDSQTLTPYFSHGIWFEILSWLSSARLYSIMSSVCKTWYTMIRQPHFVQTNLHRSKYGHIIIHKRHALLHRVILSSRFLDTVPLNIDFSVDIHSTSQGLCIFDFCGVYTVINPITMQRAKISHIDHLITRDNDFSYSAVLDRRSGEVKLVFACVGKRNRASSWYVQKLGLEKSWKMISGGHQFGPLDFPAISIAGFLIYVVCDDIVILDVSVETIQKICCPTKVCQVTYLQMRSDVLSCISHDSGRLFIHVLKDFLAGNWTLYTILDYGYIRGVSPKFHQFLGWINDSSENLFSNSEELFVRLYKTTLTISLDGEYCYKSLSGEEKCEHVTYNLDTKKISVLFGLNPYRKFENSDRVFVHGHSLLSWKTLQA